MKKIALLGAFDRYNYGDILLPHIVSKALLKIDKNLIFDFYGLVEAKLECIGGFNSRSIIELYERYDDYDAIIVVGGDVLNSTWYGMYVCLDKPFILLYKILNETVPRIANKVCKRLLNGKTKYPWLLTNCPRKIIYNCVGGLYNFDDFEKIKEIEKSVIDSVYFSCRDTATYNSLNQSINLVPDSAILISDFYRIEELEYNISKGVRKALESKYVVFQCNKKNGRNEIDTISKQLEKTVFECDVNVILLPIGNANGHEDSKVLSKIDRSTSERIIYLNNVNLWEIIFILAKAEAYIGTSLHGSITAASFNVPGGAIG